MLCGFRMCSSEPDERGTFPISPALRNISDKLEENDPYEIVVYFANSEYFCRRRNFKHFSPSATKKLLRILRVRELNTPWLFNFVINVPHKYLCSVLNKRDVYEFHLLVNRCNRMVVLHLLLWSVYFANRRVHRGYWFFLNENKGP